MRAFVTGGTGFIGGRLVRRLRTRGDDVVALVRSRAKARALAELGCELVEGDLGSETALREGMRSSDSVFHVAAVYKVGIPESERQAMFEANVRGTERVLDAAVEARAERIVYVSTIGVFGNTRGGVVDESYERVPGDFLSAYDETKYLAHRAAVDRIRSGAPIVIVQPGQVYGPGDHSTVGDQIEQARTGRLRMHMLAEVGLNFVHVDDVVEGILLAHDRGRVGEAYVLGGEIATLGEVLSKAAALSGRRPPRLTVPVALIRLAIPLGPLIGRALGIPPNLGEIVRSAAGVTYWASDAKARRELGYAPRDLETGLRDTFAATQARTE